MFNQIKNHPDLFGIICESCDENGVEVIVDVGFNEDQHLILINLLQ